MFVFAKRESKEEHVARKQQKIQIKVDFFGDMGIHDLLCVRIRPRGLLSDCRRGRTGEQTYWDMGQRHLRYLNQHHKVLYSNLLISGKLNDYLADIGEQAEGLFSRLVKQLAEKEGVTEALKAENQMLWVQKMNNIRNTAMEIVSSDLIYA